MTPAPHNTLRNTTANSPEVRRDGRNRGHLRNSSGRGISAFCVLMGLYLLVPCSLYPAADRAGVSVILISVDTLRADHLSSYGYRALQTRHIDALAERGTLFSETISQVPLTLPSHVSLLTSTYPFWNGIEDQTEILPPHAATLATVLRAKGYRTAAFVGGFALDRRFGLGQGFDIYDSPFDVRAVQGLDPSDLKRPGEEVTQAAVQWIEKNSTGPFFVFLHLYDLHTPYAFTRAQRSSFGQPSYDAELAYVDETLGRLQAFLAAKRLLEKSLIVFLSDHGESLGQHGEQTHGYFIYESTVRVPLIFHWAGAGPYPARVSAPVCLLDVAPTILQYLGFPRPQQFQGRGLLELFQRNSPAAPRAIYSESMYAKNHYGCSSLRSLRVGNYKYIDAPKREFYNLARDPGEVDNLYAQQETLALSFRERLLALQTRYGLNAQRAPQGVSPEIVERLASLGYVAITSSRPSDSGSRRDPKDRIAAYVATHRAIALAYAGHLEDSAAMLEDVLARNPDLVDARNIQGMVEQKLGRHEQAARSFEEVLRADPSNVLAHYNAGVNCFELHRLDDAGKHMEAILAIAAGTEQLGGQMIAPTEELLGRIWLEKKDYEQARLHFTRVLAVAPRDPLAEYSLGWMASQEGNWDDALQHLRAAVEFDPNNAAAHTSLGTVYAQRGQLDRAQDEFSAAARLDPNSAWTHYNLGLILQKRARNEEAAREFRKALKIDPGFQDARQALSTLEPDHALR